MKVTNDWVQRAKERLSALDMTQEALGDKLDITRGAVVHYFSGYRTPPLKQFKKMATILKCDPAWLMFGAKAVFAKESTSTTNTFRDVPLLEWDAVEDFFATKRLSQGKTETVPCVCHQKEKTRHFALKVKGDAMVAPVGHIRSFYEGDILIVDPDKKPTHGSYVIALLPDSQEATFKQYVVDGGVKYLKPLNPQYPMAKIDADVQVLGVVMSYLVTLS
jgi:SOS-response transcriptional repressor LexA